MGRTKIENRQQNVTEILQKTLTKILLRFFLIMPTATLSFVLRSTEVLVSTEVLPDTLSTTSVWKTINDNFSGLVSWHFPQRFLAV